MPEKSQAELVEEKTRTGISESGHPTPDAELAEEKRRAAVANAAGSQQGNEKRIAALLRERAGLVAQSKSDRVAQVDEQLKLYGHEADDGNSGADKGADTKTDARKQAPQGRSSKPQQTGN